MKIVKACLNQVYILIVLLYIITGMSLAGDQYFFFDLFSHFYLQLFIIVGLILCVTVISRQIKNSIGLCVLFLFLGYQVLPVIFSPSEDIQNVDLYYINANYNIPNAQEIVNDIKRYNPSYIAIVELNNDLKQRIELELGMKNTFFHESGVLSYGFFTNYEDVSYTYHQGIYPFGELILREGTVFLIHPFPPLNNELSQKQKINFDEIRSTYDNSISENKFIIGDFNSSVFSNIFQDNFGDLHAKVLYTWNRGSLLSIPIDYILGSKDSFSVITNDLSASDHSPLLIEFK